jgi:hypothetical protein
MNFKIFLLSIFLISLIGFASAEQVCEVYDDFSNGSLDLTKWEEVSPTIDEHFVQNQVYHTAQLTASDKVILLKMKDKLFSVGDTLEYDVNYVNGEGNRQTRIQLNDDVRYSLFGFWNTIEDAGVSNDLGNYHVKITFLENEVLNEITLPNGTITHTRPDGHLPSSGIEHSFGIVTRTGHNGIVHMNYDNFIICSEKLLDENDLEQRIAELENRVQELENKTSALETLVDKIVEFINKLPKGLRNYGN